MDLSLDEDSGIRGGDGEAIQQPVNEAINHPIGHVTQALINLWFKREPNDGDGLPADIGPLFTQLCDVRVQRFLHGRVLLASRLIALFRIDRQWTEQHLLPRFDWAPDPMEAKAAWEGFLWSPRLYRPLLLGFKPQFLDTARHYGELGEHGRQFAAFLTYAARLASPNLSRGSLHRGRLRVPCCPDRGPGLVATHRAPVPRHPSPARVRAVWPILDSRRATVGGDRQ